MTLPSKAEAAQTIADELAGTATDSVEARLEYHDWPAEWVMDSEFCATLDEQVFTCEGCGWWCSTDEHGEEDQYCDECSSVET